MTKENSETVGKKNELVIERIFNAPVEAIWKAWSEPETMMKWWGPNNFTMPVCKIDFRVGGKYLICMRGSPEPGMPEQDVWGAGTYQKIIPLKKIVLVDSFADEKGNIVPGSHYGMPESFPMEATISISFEAMGNDKTKMTLHYPSTEGIEGKMLEDMTQGWGQSFDKLAAMLAL